MPHDGATRGSDGAGVTDATENEQRRTVARKPNRLDEAALRVETLSTEANRKSLKPTLGTDKSKRGKRGGHGRRRRDIMR
ncbi:hypothetical protein B5F40_13005 [Gordonibacter sp. An230]|nr:hypothetical protein B5F40_13005 [Gordonibacter sp. An230]